jgi:hypothetical protein
MSSCGGVQVALHPIRVDTLHPSDDEKLYDTNNTILPASYRVCPSLLNTVSGVKQEKDVNKDLEADTKSSHKVPPEELLWENDVVTYDSIDDPQNPRNWSIRRKAFVTMLLSLTTS